MNHAFELNPCAERQLLLHAARMSLEEDRIPVMNELLECADWEVLLPLATTHGMLPLLNHHLNSRQSFPERVPANVLLIIKERCALTARQNLALTGDLLRTIRLLAKHDIIALAYKGPALAYEAYGNIALRPFLDIDILVRPSDRLNAYRILRANGYGVDVDLPEPLLIKTWSHNYVQLFDPKEGHGALEMHWSLIETRRSRSLDIDEAWQRRIPSKISPDIYTLSREDLIIALCVHGAKHEWQRLEWICCLSQIITPHGGESHNPLDWPRLNSLAYKYGCKNIVEFGISLASDLVGNEALQLVSPRRTANHLEYSRCTIDSMRQQVWNTIFKKPETNGVRSFIRKVLQLWKLQDRSFNRTSAIWQTWKFMISPIYFDHSRTRPFLWLYPLYPLINLQRRAANFLKRKSSRTRPGNSPEIM